MGYEGSMGAGGAVSCLHTRLVEALSVLLCGCLCGCVRAHCIKAVAESCSSRMLEYGITYSERMGAVK